VRVVDSHTEGEPTRLVVEGAPDLGTGPMAERRERLARDHDDLRRFAVLEPRGHDALVGALLLEPVDPSAAAGLIFFNNAGYLGMCGHATIGTAVTLHHLGRIGLGRHRFETPVGDVTVDLSEPNACTVENVASRRTAAAVTVEVPGLGPVTGDVAWGGNWFFLVKHAPVPIDFAGLKALADAADRVRAALVRAGITGDDGREIDHIEFFGPPTDARAMSRNYVHCPGGAYDRSPCGTGTSAKLACLAADGTLAPGEPWVQESIVGSRFTARYRLAADGSVIPSITGRAFVTAETVLVRQPGDPFADGIWEGTIAAAG
jgi:4-hydroxyproline epimerase